MSSEDTSNIFGNIHESVFEGIFGGGEGSKKALKIVGVVVALAVIVVIIYFIYRAMSGFGNGRIVGSGCGRYNQLQRAVNFEFPLSQNEYEDHESAKERAAGIHYSNSYQPPMENVYAGFEDRKGGVEVEQYQVRPIYPQSGPTQSVFNDNVFHNIAYD
jgi:hypothetical protein